MNEKIIERLVNWMKKGNIKWSIYLYFDCFYRDKKYKDESYYHQKDYPSFNKSDNHQGSKKRFPDSSTEKFNINTKEKIHSMDFIKLIESKFLKPNLITSATKNNNLEIGDIIKIGYTIFEGEKERVQYYEGLVISISNRGLGKSFTLRRSVQGIGVEQIFLVNSPKIN